MRYLNSLKNQTLAARGWMFATLVLSFISCFLAVNLAFVSSNQIVRLVPQSFDSYNGFVDVGNKIDDNSEYLTQLAIADVMMFASWTPKTVESQTSRFVNRFSAALYGDAGQQLETASKARASEQQSQALAVTKTAIDGNTVKLTGEITIWQGSTRVSDARMEYTVTYTVSGGKSVPVIKTFKAEVLK